MKTLFFQKLWVRVWCIPICVVFHGRHHRYHSMGYDHDYHTCSLCRRFWRVPRPGQGGGLWTPSQGKIMNAKTELRIREQGGRLP